MVVELGQHIKGRPQAQQNLQEQDAEDFRHKRVGWRQVTGGWRKLSNDDSQFVALATETTAF